MIRVNIFHLGLYLDLFRPFYFPNSQNFPVVIRAALRLHSNWHIRYFATTY